MKHSWLRLFMLTSVASLVSVVVQAQTPTLRLDSVVRSTQTLVLDQDREGSVAGSQDGKVFFKGGAVVKDIAASGLVLKQASCTINTMGCGSSVSGVLTASDCDLGDGTVVDFWEFQGDAGSRVTIDLTSSQFDTVLFLLDPTPTAVALDDDSGSGTNARIVHTLDSSGPWTIAANNLIPGDLGSYNLSLTCSGSQPTPPAAPSNLTAMPISTTEVQLRWQDNANNETEYRVEVRGPGGSFQDLGQLPADTIGGDVFGLLPGTRYDFRARARNAAGFSSYSNVASATTLEVGDADCTPDEDTLCLNGGRFRVEVAWRDFGGGTGSAQVVPVESDDSGLLYFFDANNWEMLVKVLDACDLAGFNTFWVFAAATTDVEYTLTVTDTATGVVKQYFNPLGNAAPAITDTGAFATCM